MNKRFTTIRVVATGMATATLAAGLTACAGSASSATPTRAPEPTVTVTKTATAEPVPAKTHPAPAKTTPVPTSASTGPKMVTKVFSGKGDWTSAPIHFGCAGGTGLPLTATDRFSGNETMGSADNFEAEVDDSQGAQVGMIENTIAVSGTKTTSLYPGESNVPPFHLSITATGDWTISLSCQAR